MYKNIGVAVAFSPSCKAIIGEAARLQRLFDAELILIHVGDEKQDEKACMKALVEPADVNVDKLKIIWKKGHTANKILSIGETEKIN